MKIYLVGGAVRDQLTGRKPHDFDYVVTGATPEQMLQAGFVPVGKDFPVFLHPETHCEYALARKEIKTGAGHRDFEFVFSPEITLQEDLERRDFTCNAIAKDTDSGELIDFHGGTADIRNRILRHVNSKHFPEDPLRVIRMCRFAAQLGFSVAPETMDLAKKMVQNGELAHLSPERIWGELQKALNCHDFWQFVVTARQCGALAAILPEAEKLWQTPELPQFHPEGNSGDHTQLCLQAAGDEPNIVKFAVLLHDIGKTLTPAEILPHHYEHETAGLPLIEKICNRLKVPNDYCRFAKIVCAQHMKFCHIRQMKIAALLRLADAVVGSHHPEYAEYYIAACRADNTNMPAAEFDANAERLRQVIKISAQIHATDMQNFAALPKDEKFKEIYWNFRCREVQKKLTDNNK